MKGNQPGIKEAVDLWLEERWARGRPAPAQVTVDKGHGRLERREIWWVEGGELGAHLQQEFDWPGVRVCGRIRRYRRRATASTWEQVEEHTWVTSAPVAQATPKQVEAWLRGHWGIEKRVFRVRDVSYDEERLHGHKIGLALSALRNGALNLIRHWGYRYIPDAWRTFSEGPQNVLALLSAPLLEC